VGRTSREKGARVEREIVNLHKAIGIRSERYPLSGSSRFRGSGHDTDIYVWGDREAPAVCEVKARANGEGFAVIEKWLGEFDALFLKRNNATPLVVLPFRVWLRLLEKVRRT
jgi:Holliday junction resolvase